MVFSIPSPEKKYRSSVVIFLSLQRRHRIFLGPDGRSAKFFGYLVRCLTSACARSCMCSCVRPACSAVEVVVLVNVRVGNSRKRTTHVGGQLLHNLFILSVGHRCRDDDRVKSGGRKKETGAAYTSVRRHCRRTVIFF